MKHPLFKDLGHSYPIHLETHFDRILTQIEKLWDKPEIDDYFSELLIDKRGGRNGFSKDVMRDIMFLHDYHQSQKLRQAERQVDAIRELEHRGVTLDKKNFLQAINEGNFEIVDLFVRANFNIHTEDDQGTPALIIALKKSYTIIGRILINAGADINAKDRIGMTPLLLTCGKFSSGNKEIAEMLINKGANINVRDLVGFTPLLLSLTGGVSGVAELLIEKGADLHAATRTGKNALSLAEMTGNTKIAELIRRKLQEQLK
jgi:tankyrase